VADDFMQLFKGWVKREVAKVAGVFVQFGLQVVEAGHRGVDNKKGELVGASLFVYAVELLVECLQESDRQEVTVEGIDERILEFLTGILVESKDVHTLVHTLKLYYKTVEYLVEKVQGNRD
jgi:transposase